MSIERSAESFLVEVVTDETYGTTKDEEAVEGADLIYKRNIFIRKRKKERKKGNEKANLDIFIRLFRSECTTVSQ
jgi:hypothetical protein